MKYSSTLRTLALSTAVSVLASASGMAQTTWNGATDLNWSTSTNWTPDTVPVAGVTALLNNTEAARTIVYDDAAANTGFLGGLTMTQTSAFANILDIQKNLTITDAVNLSATNGGTSQITVNPGTGTRTVRFNGGLTVGSGGALSLLFGSSGSAHYTPVLSGNITLSGGTITLGAPVYTGSSSTSAYFSNDLSVSSGTITVNNSGTGGTTRDVRITVAGNFAATGGSLVTTDSGTAGSLTLSGATNSFSNFTFAPNYGIMLDKAGDQTLTGLPVQTTGLLTIRGNGTKTVSGTTVGPMQFVNQFTNGTLVALKLGSNLTLGSGVAMIKLADFGAIAGTVATQLGIDAGGHTLDMSAAATTGTTAGTNGVWKPNTTTNAQGTVWALSSSAANGVIKAKGFDFTSANVTTTVGANLTLESTGGTSIANNLGNGTALDVASTFKYSGSAVATLASGRNIGTLLVSSGTLQATGTTFQAAGGIQVASGAKLDFTTVALTAPTLTLDINGTTAAQLLTNTDGGFTYTGNDLVLNFATAVADPSTFDLLSFTTGPTGQLDSLALTGFYTGTLLDTDLDGIWTGSAGDRSFSFSQATGDLNVVPEPATWALLAGAGTFLMVMRRRRRA